ncbi:MULTISPECIES: archaetidylserine decarboxylase [unclassified Halomonas]|uniref:archaetidylserine decarboxylase n=1 Tax=unclassified Halomonas TaxID=2609666 RepID=UPI0007D9C4DF|nr:archaetidylserine decarboxylase [Halomonas sp. ALS9]MBT2787432.1 phosphatidylserine decarboxylase [Halomonas sp. ISL-106]MBT2796206.1 phosphatidylserine decarboxylase [Halomonas sp. ISL-104]OAL57639.1 phosphatidylserine decarboxylase [Halomonas sp. ALS9]
MTLSQKAFSLLQYPLPHHALSRLTGKFAQCDNPWVKNNLIKAFIKRFDVDMSQALEPDPTAYATFNDFFTRALKADARPLGDGILSPADGTLSQYGRLQAGQLVQAKGHTYSAQTLLGGDTALAEEFLGGSFATVYLSPRDYHRVHMPVTGTLREMIYVPGRLFSVNQATANYVPGLFARNERLVCIFDTPQGPMAMVLVGAMIVAAIETVWSGQVTPLSGHPQRIQFGQPITLEKGAEMGRFKLGSTVVMCFAKPVNFEERPLATMVSMGESLAAL